MQGQRIASEFHALQVVIALDRGTAQRLLNANTSVWDAIAYADDMLTIRTESKRCDGHLTNYCPTGLVEKSNGGLKWSPDPGYSTLLSYRNYRWIHFAPIGKVHGFDAALMTWETGHEDESTFINALANLASIEKCYAPTVPFTSEELTPPA